MTQAAAVMIPEEGQRWRIELKQYAKIEAAVGRDVINGFCRCFVHADRLNSMISFAHISGEFHGQESLAFGRDLHTMVWFTVGTLRELAIAIRELREALRARGLLDENSAQWVKLAEFEARWNQDPMFKRMRNKAAFHVDASVIDTGLNELMKDGDDLVLSQGDGPKALNSLLTLGFNALMNGLGFSDLKSYGDFVGTVSKDHSVGDAIQEAFVLALESKGIMLGGKLPADVGDPAAIAKAVGAGSDS